MRKRSGVKIRAKFVANAMAAASRFSPHATS